MKTKIKKILGYALLVLVFVIIAVMEVLVFISGGIQTSEAIMITIATFGMTGVLLLLVNIASELIK